MSSVHCRIVRLALLVLVPLIAGQSAPAAAESVGRTAPEPPRALAPVLLVDGGDTPDADAWYDAFMDSTFGVGDWDRYDLPEQGLPNPPELFLSVLRQYSVVLWHAGDAGAAHLGDAMGVLADYVDPEPAESAAGKLLLVAPSFYNAVYLSADRARFTAAVGLYPLMSPPNRISLPVASTALALVPDLPDLEMVTEAYSSTGLQPLVDTETLLQMEYCIPCYNNRRPPFDPVVGTRIPDRATSPIARAVVLTLPLQQTDHGLDALETLLIYHLGIVPSTATDGGAGKVRLAVNNSGYFGSFFAGPDSPSLVYPYPGYVEHLYHGGPWVGARLPDGTVHVSTAADDYSNLLAGDEIREFAPAAEEMTVISNVPYSDNYDPAAVAPWEMSCAFNDLVTIESGIHTPLGVKVLWRAMSWDDYPIDDGVVLEYRVVNESGADLHDVYLGLYTDTTVGNIQVNTPYYPVDGALPMWNWYDDMNGGWRPGDVADDPDIWMMWEHDDDGDDGWATSWVGTRLLGTDPPVSPAPGDPPVSYNAWVFRRGPAEDDTYLDPDDGVMVPGRYQTMSNGHFDVGETAEINFDAVSDWEGMLSTGPFPVLAAGDTLTVTWALVCGDGAWDLQRNARRFAELKANNWQLDLSAAPDETPSPTFLSAAAPNPFNPSTEIRFGLERGGWTRLEVFGVDGRRVAVLVDGLRTAGEHAVRWHGRGDDGRAAPSGLYLYRLTAPDGARRVGHMTLVK